MSESIESTTPEQTSTTEAQGDKANNIEAMERKNRELLGLVKKYKDELQSVKKVVDEVKQSELEKQGKYTDLYKQTQEELAKTRQELERERENFKHDKIKSHIARKAMEKGAVDVDLVYRLIDQDDYSLVNVDERGTVDEQSIEQLLALAAQRTKIDLFKPKVPSTKDAPLMPGHRINVNAPQKSVSEMTLSELKEAYKQTRR